MKSILAFIAFCFIAACAISAAPVNSFFTYQGRLADGNGAANGVYDLQFELFDSSTDGAGIGPVLTNNAVPISNGLFSVSLDFGAGAFDGQMRWLQISVKTNNSSTFTTLAPRQAISAAPYALDAAKAESVEGKNITGVIPDVSLSTNVSLLGQSQVFTGTNFFQGPLFLTNGGNVLAGIFSGNGGGLSNIPPVTTVLTTNSSVSQIKAAVAKGGLIWFQPGDYWAMDNLQLTSGTVILGWNAVLHAKPGLTNFLIDEDINTANISIYGLTVAGDRYLAYTDPNFLSFVPHPLPYYQANLINHGGMRLNMASGGTIADCSAYGFGGYGFMLVSRNGSSAANTLGGFFHGNHAHDNGVGVGVLGAAFDYPGYPYAPANTWPVRLITDEHQLISGNEMFANGIGLYAPGGNCFITGNKITGNNFGIVLGPGDNNTHGEVVGNTLNHNNYAFIAYSAVGEVIKDNIMLDINALSIISCGYLILENNHIGGQPTVTLTVTNNPLDAPSFVTIAHNSYAGSWGKDFLLKTNFGTAPGKAYVYGNRSYSVTNDTDGSTISLEEIGAGATTNYSLGGTTLWITNGMIMKVQ